VLVGAQNCERELVSENASVVMWRPAAMSRRTATGPSFSITIVPQ
jgi:hypothetical protein